MSYNKREEFFSDDEINLDEKEDLFGKEGEEFSQDNFLRKDLLDEDEELM
ncbi:MAG: hypothetical protein QMD86_01315 [Patescibacteria group bacterium]|nr:hypothetical protein [Patescibacteria group bacterium]